ncbi:MAG TPA: iron-containing alcohol dehydrogenase [Acidimicrobiia bacterium]|nr:iron-containing alcohol dehydrogenase [Acidimicrobiia bacterium]
MGWAGAGGAAAPGRPPLPILCVGTTLSFAEFLPFFGARHAAVARKRPYSEAGTASRTVFLDGEVAAHTPVGLWRETGVKALDDALSAFCRAGAPEPFADPVLTAAMGELARALLASREAGDAGGAAARQHAFTAVWMTKASLPRLAPFAVPAWFSTAARHSLGAVLELPHGVGSCVALVPGLRFQLDATGAREHELHASVAWPPAVRRDALIETVAALLDALAVPTRLGAVVDGDPRLDEVATAMCEEAPALGPPSAVRRVCDEMV